MQTHKQHLPVPPDILVVDDVPENLHLLSGMLKERGYKVRSAPSGLLALEAVRKMTPDLILLDINMPGLNGYETCERLKADPASASIPVIFISALSETMDKVKSFAVGGVDYVAKPFQFEEVEARVRTHLELQRQRRQLEENYEKLRQLESLRDSLVHMVVHDMRSPITAISVYVDLLKETLASRLDDEEQGWLDEMSLSTRTLTEMVSQLLDITRMESGNMPLDKKECKLSEVAASAIGPLRILAETRLLKLDAPEAIQVSCDANVVRRIIGNMVGNAIKFTESEGEVRVAIARSGPDFARVSVSDDGPGIHLDCQGSIFEKFSQVKGKTKNLGFGLGLTFCRLAVEEHGGRIGVESEPGKGSTFWFELPMDFR